MRLRRGVFSCVRRVTAGCIPQPNSAKLSQVSLSVRHQTGLGAGEEVLQFGDVPLKAIQKITTAALNFLCLLG